MGEFLSVRLQNTSTTPTDLITFQNEFLFQNTSLKVSPWIEVIKMHIILHQNTDFTTSGSSTIQRSLAMKWD